MEEKQFEVKISAHPQDFNLEKVGTITGVSTIIREDIPIEILAQFRQVKSFGQFTLEPSEVSRVLAYITSGAPQSESALKCLQYYLKVAFLFKLDNLAAALLKHTLAEKAVTILDESLSESGEQAINSVLMFCLQQSLNEGIKTLMSYPDNQESLKLSDFCLRAVVNRNNLAALQHLLDSETTHAHAIDSAIILLSTAHNRNYSDIFEYLTKFLSDKSALPTTDAIFNYYTDSNVIPKIDCLRYSEQMLCKAIKQGALTQAQVEKIFVAFCMRQMLMHTLGDERGSRHGLSPNLFILQSPFYAQFTPQILKYHPAGCATQELELEFIDMLGKVVAQLAQYEAGFVENNSLMSISIRAKQAIPSADLCAGEYAKFMLSAVMRKDAAALRSFCQVACNRPLLRQAAEILAVSPVTEAKAIAACVNQCLQAVAEEHKSAATTTNTEATSVANAPQPQQAKLKP